MISSLGSANLNQISQTNAPTYSTEAKREKQPKLDKEVVFSYNPQDQVVMEPKTTKLHGVTMGRNGRPSTNRVSLGTKLRPNEGGDFVFKKNTNSFVAASSMATVAKTLNAFEEAYGAKIPWAFDNSQIEIKPDGGEMLNAYYSRDDASLNFFHAQDPVTNSKVFTGTSGEVVSHEAGHAILDGLRPDYFSSWEADTNGFHEAFGDLTGLFMATQDDSVCQMAAQQTGGDLSISNCLSETGEELGQTINNTEGQNVTGGSYIRNCINDFKWQAPSTVPDNPSGTDPLTTEMHSWSRIWTGAQYDAMGDMVQRNMKEGQTAAEAIKSAGKECMVMYANLLKIAPQSNCTYHDMAMCLLQVDQKENGGRNHDILLNNFRERNILFEGEDVGLNMASNAESTQREVTVTLDGSEFGMFAGAEVSTKVDDNGVGVMSNSASSLKDNMKAHIRNGSILYTEPNQKVEKKDLFDKNGNPYIGVVRWTDGKMVIERNMMIS